MPMATALPLRAVPEVVQALAATAVEMAEMQFPLVPSRSKLVRSPQTAALVQPVLAAVADGMAKTEKMASLAEKVATAVCDRQAINPVPQVVTAAGAAAALAVTAAMAATVVTAVLLLFPEAP